MTAQSPVTSGDIEQRDSLIAAQESLLNVYRCRFDIDTQVVPGGCTNGLPSQDQPELDPFTGVATQAQLDTRDSLIAAQESLLNVYRCRFDIDTQVVPGGCTNGLPSVSTSTEPESGANGVGYFEATYVDSQRITPPSGSDPGRDNRSLRTIVIYPAAVDGTATTAVENAQPAGGPYPLVLFGHGFGSLPDNNMELLSAIAAGGYVVAAPEFPRTSANNPSAPDASDTESQPGDLSFLIDTMGGLTADPKGPLFGTVDIDRVAVVGHSNGGVTVFGISANSCCRDKRIDVAIALAPGPAVPFDGEYDFTNTPPFLLVHGTKDSAAPYQISADIFNKITAVKGLLILEGGDHHTWRSPGHEFFSDVSTTILDFMAVALDGDRDAVDRLKKPRSSSNAELFFAEVADSGLTYEFEDVASVNRMASAEPATGLVHGQKVLVTWSGYLPGQTVNIIQCSQGAMRDPSACDFSNAKILHPNPTGSGSVELVIIVGSVGNGVCDATVDDCVIAVNDSGLQVPEATIRIPLSFAR